MLIWQLHYCIAGSWLTLLLIHLQCHQWMKWMNCGRKQVISSASSFILSVVCITLFLTHSLLHSLFYSFSTDISIDPLPTLSSHPLCSYQRLANWTAGYYEMMVGFVNILLQSHNQSTVNNFWSDISPFSWTRAILMKQSCKQTQIN